MATDPTTDPTRSFLRLKAEALQARARQIVALTPAAVGLRARDMLYAPSPAHFAAARSKLGAIDRVIQKRTALAVSQGRSGPHPTHEDRLLHLAMLERDVDRARRIFGLLFEIFAQRGTNYAPALAAYDVIAADCYRAMTEGLPGVFLGPVLGPVSYLEHGYSPATVRRGISLSRLLGDSLPFPIIRIPWDRDKPWQPVFLHEVAHNLQADTRLWDDTQQGVVKRFIESGFPRAAVATAGRWHKEVFADLAALLLGGPAAAFGLAEFLAQPSDRVMTYRPNGAHPTGYPRVLILVEMLRRMGFAKDADRLNELWRTLYSVKRGARMPAWLLQHMPRFIATMVDEIAYQPRRNLANKLLANVIRFNASDQEAIQRGAFDLKSGRPPIDLPPRHVVSACRYALEAGAEPNALGALIIRVLSTAPRANVREPVPRRVGPVRRPGSPPAPLDLSTAA